VALVSAMYPVAEQVRANRIVKGVSIPHPCGDPSLPPELDARLRREIVQTALKALGAEVKSAWAGRSAIRTDCWKSMAPRSKR